MLLFECICVTNWCFKCFFDVHSIPTKSCNEWLIVREWTVPGGSAIPGQSVNRLTQAPMPCSDCKNQFNIGARLCLACQILSWQEQILHMILAKRPRSDVILRVHTTFIYVYHCTILGNIDFHWLHILNYNFDGVLSANSVLIHFGTLKMY